MTAEPIAKVIEDLRDLRCVPTADRKSSLLAVAQASQVKTVVDATSIYRSLAEASKEVNLYEDHPCISPTWADAAVCYVNEHGNVIVMHMTVQTDLKESDRWESDTNIVDWQNVKWIINVFVFVGGVGQGKPINTHGPMHAWRFAVHADGSPADLRWLQLVERYPMENWDMAHLVIMGALNFSNCRNIQLVEPHRPRAEARRIQRTGVTVKTINVFPMGKSYKSNPSPGEPFGVPLTSVRGHYAHYGDDYGRGKLFGKISGRFWIPPTARGDKSIGENEHDYVLCSDKPKETANV